MALAKWSPAMGLGMKHAPCLPAPRTPATSRLGALRVRAAADDESRKPPPGAAKRPAPKQPARLPESGFFAQADPNAPMYPISKTKKTDLTKRSKDKWESDFIWNTNWQDQLDYEEAQRKKAEEAKNAPPPEQKGGISFGRVADLNDMSIDLSEQLKPRPKKEKPTPKPKKRRPMQRRNPAAYAANPGGKKESKRWSRGGRYAKTAPVIQTKEDLDEEQLAIAELESARYEQLKQEFVLWTLATTVVTAAVTYAFYSRDTTISYLVGALGGITYLRLLNKSVDGYGGAGAGAAIGGTVGQQRLLIPVILALGFNRWNTLVADQYDVHLNLLPILLGFFTYKGAVIGRQSVELFSNLTEDIKSQNKGPDFSKYGYGDEDEDDEDGEQSGGKRAPSEAETAAANVDRAFTKKVIQG